MKRLLILMIFALPVAAHADAEDVVVPPAECFAHSEEWAYDSSKETLAAPGERFMEKMKSCAPKLASSIAEAERYALQDGQAKIFARHSQYVMIAYGVAWGVLALAAMGMIWRQKKLSDTISELEAKLREAVKS